MVILDLIHIIINAQFGEISDSHIRRSHESSIFVHAFEVAASTKLHDSIFNYDSVESKNRVHEKGYNSLLLHYQQVLRGKEAINDISCDLPYSLYTSIVLSHGFIIVHSHPNALLELGLSYEGNSTTTSHLTHHSNLTTRINLKLVKGSIDLLYNHILCLRSSITTRVLWITLD